MIRRLVNSVIETALQIPAQPIAYPVPFHSAELQHLGWLSSTAPCFPVSAQNITILDEPCEFYARFLHLCATATSRITLASLYLGNGKLEQQIVDAIAGNRNVDRLRINVLLDYSRGSRQQLNSRVMLRPLLERCDQAAAESSGQCTVSLYHTPALRGVWKKIAPDRFNELFGIQHMKLYIFDDTLLISGANLSSDYFTNRQDRYFLIKDKPLCDFYTELVSKVQEFSLCVDKNDQVQLPASLDIMPYEGSKFDFIDRAGESIENFIFEAKEEHNSHIKSGHDTWIFPLLQMGQLGIDQDAYATDKIFADAPENTHINIATAYFNLTQDYINTLIHESQAKCNLLIAHPTANGFLGASGMAGGIPDGYSLIASRFEQKIHRAKQNERFNLAEYVRDGWTYHVKGLWYYPVNCDTPAMTLIGSPNFGARSVDKDLETQVAIVTENPELRARLHDECQRIYQRGQPAQLDRSIPAWVYAMVFMFRGFF